MSLSHCEYCGATLDLSISSKCPNCGGTQKTAQEPKLETGITSTGEIVKKANTTLPETKLWDDRFKKGVAIGSVLMIILNYGIFVLNLFYGIERITIILILGPMIAGVVAATFAGAENKRGRKAGFWSMGAGAASQSFLINIFYMDLTTDFSYLIGSLIGVFILLFIIIAIFGSLGGYLVEVLQKKTH